MPGLLHAYITLVGSDAFLAFLSLVVAERWMAYTGWLSP